MYTDIDKLWELTNDININEVTEHIKDSTLDQWLINWRIEAHKILAVMFREIDSATGDGSIGSSENSEGEDNVRV